jgi:uncharacterized RDD family membrane protein YckC
MEAPLDASVPSAEKKSTLIEFPGVARNSLPEWRKELSERVREIQEKRAREAAREAAEAERRRMEAAINPPQLELLPPAQMPAMNPLVAAALKRIERAHQTAAPTENHQPGKMPAVAVAYAPEREENDVSETVAPDTQLAFETEIRSEDVPVVPEKPHLAVVQNSEPVASRAEPRQVPRRLIVENDPALNYLDSISRSIRIDEIAARRASVFRRLICALLDLVFCGLLSSPIALAIQLTGNDLQDARVIAVLAGNVIVVMFLYLTLMTALTGRTWAMRLLSLRVIDTKTGLIPTGGQSVGRSILYLLSLATGVGVLFVLLNPERYTVHDRFTRTAVITN